MTVYKKLVAMNDSHTHTHNLYICGEKLRPVLMSMDCLFLNYFIENIFLYIVKVCKIYLAYSKNINKIIKASSIHTGFKQFIFKIQMLLFIAYN